MLDVSVEWVATVMKGQSSIAYSRHHSWSQSNLPPICCLSSLCCFAIPSVTNASPSSLLQPVVAMETSLSPITHHLGNGLVSSYWFVKDRKSSFFRLPRIASPSPNALRYPPLQTIAMETSLSSITRRQGDASAWYIVRSGRRVGERVAGK